MSDLAADLVPAELPSGIVGTTDRPLPAFARLDGRIVVVIEVAEYRELVAATSRHARAALAPRRTPPEPVGLSTIERDPEVAAFLRERFPRRETTATLYAACIERFGATRTPSASRISTFRTRWKRSR